MAEPMTLFSPLNVAIGGIVIVMIVVISIILRNKQGIFKTFVPRLFGETVYDEMKKKMNLHGNKVKGKMYIGFHKIALVERYMHTTGKMAGFLWDEKTREMVEEDKTTNYKFMILRCKSNNLLFRLLGLKKMYFILKNEDDKITFDEKETKIFLPVGTDLKSYGNVWHNSEIAMEYVNDISIKRMDEQIMTHVENAPDRIVHLEMQLAKNERLARTLSDIEKGRYEKTKTADETVIS